MKEYGYHIEFVMEVDSASSVITKPDIVKISYFETAESKRHFETDPAHAIIERDFHPAAFDGVIWIEANIHPSVLVE